MAKLFFNQKLFHSSAKMFQVPSFGNMGNTVYLILPYMVETVGKKKKPAKHGEMRWTPKQ